LKAGGRQVGAKQRSADGSRRSGIETGASRTRLFDADRTDHHLSYDAALAKKLTERQLLWIDVTSPMDPKPAAALVERLDLKPATQGALVEGLAVSTIALHGTYFTPPSQRSPASTTARRPVG